MVLATLNEMNFEYMKRLSKLKPENKEIYLEISRKIKKDFRLSDVKADEILSDILDHLIDAQKDGISAQEFFGHDIENYVQEVTDELPKESPKNQIIYIGAITSMTIAIVCLIFGFFSFLKLISTGQLLKVPSISLMIAIIFLLVLVPIYSYLTTHYFKPKISKYRYIKVILFSLVYFIPYSLLTFIKIGPLVDFPVFISITVGLITVFISYKLFKKNVIS